MAWGCSGAPGQWSVIGGTTDYVLDQDVLKLNDLKLSCSWEIIKITLASLFLSVLKSDWDGMLRRITIWARYLKPPM